MNWKKYDFYSKGIDGIQVKTSGGGFVTLITAALALVLILSEIYYCFSTTVINRMFVDTAHGQTQSLSISMDVIISHAPCEEIRLDISDSKGNREMLLHDGVKKSPYKKDGCRFVGSVKVQKVAAEIGFLHTGTPNMFNLFEFLQMNTSHVINRLEFGPYVPNRVNPLTNVEKIVTESVAAYKYFVKVVPTKYTYLYGTKVNTFQYSATEHSYKSQGNGQMVFPGIILSYDFSPITVDYVEHQPTLLQFVTNICGLVGGLFAVAGIVDRFIYRVSQKVD